MLKVILSSFVFWQRRPRRSPRQTRAARRSPGAGRDESYAGDSGGPLTLDIVACGRAGAGSSVEANDKCGGTALKLDAGGTSRSNTTSVRGHARARAGNRALRRADVGLRAGPEPAGALELQIIGDTGGQFRAYRRSFPFEAHWRSPQGRRVPRPADGLVAPVDATPHGHCFRHCFPLALRSTIGTGKRRAG